MSRPKLYSDIVVVVENKDERLVWGKIRELVLDDLIVNPWTFSCFGKAYTTASCVILLQPELQREMEEIGWTKDHSSKHSDFRPSECSHVAGTFIVAQDTRSTRINGGQEAIDRAVEKHRLWLEDPENKAPGSLLIASALYSKNQELERAWRNRRYEAIRRIGQAYAQYKVEDERLQPMYDEMQRLREARQKIDAETDLIVSQAQHAKLDEASKGDPEEFVKLAHEALDKERAARRHPFG